MPISAAGKIIKLSGVRRPRFFGDFFIPVPRSLIIFPAQGGSVGYVSAFAEP